jgi:hypothetical protein
MLLHSIGELSLEHRIRCSYLSEMMAEYELVLFSQFSEDSILIFLWALNSISSNRSMGKSATDGL